MKTGGAQCVLNICIPSMLRELSGSFYSRYSAMVEKEKKKKNRKESEEKKEKKNFNSRLTDLATNSLADLSHSHIVIDMFFFFFYLKQTVKQRNKRKRDVTRIFLYRKGPRPAIAQHRVTIM